MARPRHSLNPARVATRSEDLSKLSSEVLKLRLQSLNLPITGSKAQLLARPKQTLTGKASQSKRRPGRPQRTRPTANKTSTQQPSTSASGIDAVQGWRLGIPEDNTLSGSPVTMVRKRKPVIESFQKWLEAYMVYMLVIVTAYSRWALELIKYQQIISRAVTKFKGLAWLSYDQQFRRHASSNLSLQWDKVDLELWTVTFSGLAKPHCSSPYHAEDFCPSADPCRKQRRSQTVCFDFNKSSGCWRRNCSYPHICRRCHSNSHTVQDYPQWLSPERRSPQT